MVAEELYRRHPSSDEGRLTRLKHYIVSRRSCAAVGRQTDLGSRMLAHGAERGRDDAARLVGTPTVLAGLVEAAIGAIYLEHGWETARDAVITSFEERFRPGGAERPRPQDRAPGNPATSGAIRTVRRCERHRPGP